MKNPEQFLSELKSAGLLRVLRDVECLSLIHIYVGGAPNKINLYVKHTPVKFNIPQEEAVERLVDLIKEYGRWVDPK